MGAVQIVATVLAAAVTVVAVVLVVRAVRRMIAVIRLGQPDPERFAGKGGRTAAMLTEIAGHTRMLKWTTVGVAHWVVMVSFVLLSALVLGAYFEVVDPTAHLPLIGAWSVYGLVTEVFSVLAVPAIGFLMAVRLTNRPSRGRSRFTGSTMWQGYFVEWIILLVLVCGLLIRGLLAAAGELPFPTWAA